MAEIDEAYRKWAEGLSEKIIAKMEYVVMRNKGKIPYVAKDGVWNDCSKESIGWWTNGFWGGINWQLFKATGNPVFKESADWTEAQMDRVFLDYKSMDHDSGFRWLPTSYASFALTRSKASYNRLRLAADNLAGRFNSTGNFIRAWNEEGKKTRAGYAIIDCLMNLPLLYWAARATGDYRYHVIATRHVDTVLSHFIREDGSAVHIAEFDPKSGEFLRTYGGQGMQEGSSLGPVRADPLLPAYQGGLLPGGGTACRDLLPVQDTGFLPYPGGLLSAGGLQLGGLLGGGDSGMWPYRAEQAGCAVCGGIFLRGDQDAGGPRKEQALPGQG